MGLRKKKVIVTPPAFSEEQLEYLNNKFKPFTKSLTEISNTNVKLSEKVDKLLTPKEETKEVTVSNLIKFTGGNSEIHIDYHEFKELPEILHKFLKRNGIDNTLIVK